MKRLVLHMVVILIIGLVPDYFMILFYGWLVSITPASLVFTIAWFITAPLLFWALYFVYWGSTVIMTHVFLAYYDTRSPAEADIVIKRQFKDKTLLDYKKLHYYHMRGAIVKYSLWITAKCPVPSLLKRVLNYYGHNKIDSPTVIYENLYPGLEFTEIKHNAVLEVGSTLSTHVVESLYGNLVIGKIVLEPNSIVGVNTVVGPGIIVPENCAVGDNCMTFKNWPLEHQEPGCGFFNGSPAKCASLEMMFADGPLKEQYKNATQVS